MKLKHLMGTVTIIAIVGGTIYAIKKSKDLKKQEEEAISVGEAMAYVQEYKKNNEIGNPRMTPEEEEAEYFNDFDEPDEIDYGYDMEQLKDDIRDAAIADTYEVHGYPAKEVEQVEEDELYQGMELDRPWKEYMTEEDKVLRYEQNSKEALQQFIKMELAEWAPMEHTYQAMVKLFDFPFNPENDGDYDLKTAIIDYRVNFFGFGSKWTQQITFADVILHYARSAYYNQNESVRYWVEYFMQFIYFDYTTSSKKIDEMITKLNQHSYFNDAMGTFGLFGLSEKAFEDACIIANRNIDKTLTYDIEFNEFLKSCL